MVKPQKDYSSVVGELQQRALERRQPLNGHFELTDRCNLNCRMCYVCQPANKSSRRGKELTAEKWLEVARQASESGMVFLLLTGGEVFLRSDFFEIYKPLTKMGFMITIYSNGTLITDSTAARLAESPPSRVGITIYGSTAETYEAITGVPGSFSRCCAGIEALIKYNIPLQLKTTLTSYNVGELDAMRQMAKNWGLPFDAAWFLYHRRDDKFSNVEDCRLSPFDCVELEATDQASAFSNLEMTEKEVDEMINKTAHAKNRNFHCSAGRNAFIVSAQGEMNACLVLSKPSLRILEIGFRKAWENLQQFVDNAPPLSRQCLECDLLGFCLRCPASSESETGTLTDPVPYICEIAKERKNRYAR